MVLHIGHPNTREAKTDGSLGLLAYLESSKLVSDAVWNIQNMRMVKVDFWSL